MASSSSTGSCSNTNTKERKQFSNERRPRMLKDFLRDDSSSCTCEDISIRNLIQIDINARTKSKAAASTTSFSFQAIINTIKNIPFATSVKSPSFLPRSLSKKNLPKKSEKKVTVTVKDIIRWRSFRDLIEEKSQPLDFFDCTTTTTATGSTISTLSGGSSSNGSSWCESDFTSEYLPPWRGNSKEYGENEVAMGKKNLPCVGGDSTEGTTYTVVGPKGDLHCEEKEQHSPVSVLHFQFEDDEKLFQCSNQSHTDMKRTKQKLMQKIQRLEIMNKLDPINLEKWMSVDENTNLEDEHEHEKEEPNEVEYKARQLLNHVKATTSVVNLDNMDQQQLLLDFFRDELTSKRDQIKNDEFDCEMVRIAKAWINGEHSMSINEWGLKHNRVANVKEMEKEWRWTKFEEEQRELDLEIENGVLVNLVDELLNELLS